MGRWELPIRRWELDNDVYFYCCYSVHAGTLGNVKRQEKKNKGHSHLKGDKTIFIQTLLFYIENSNLIFKNILELIIEFIKVIAHKSNIQNQLCFCIIIIDN